MDDIPNTNELIESMSKMKKQNPSTLVILIIAGVFSLCLKYPMVKDNYSLPIIVVAILFLLMYFLKLCHKIYQTKKSLKDISTEDLQTLKTHFSKNITSTFLIKREDEYTLTFLIDHGILIKSQYGSKEGYVPYSLSPVAIAHIRKSGLFN